MMLRKQITLNSREDIIKWGNAVLATYPLPPMIPIVPSISGAIPLTPNEREKECRGIEDFFLKNPNVHSFMFQAELWLKRANEFNAQNNYTVTVSDDSMIAVLESVEKSVSKQIQDVVNRFDSQTQTFNVTALAEKNEPFLY